MRMAAYCRVSTEKEEQVQSLENQINYFEGLAKEKNHQLIKIYPDEGLKGTQLKKRKQFNQMMVDAKKRMFDIIYVKDVSRFARNTVDFLQNIREIKSYGIEIWFTSNGLGIQEGNEMYLTMLAMMAQEESFNLSKKTKFGKDITAKKGRVPNFVYGYDKIDNYTLAINPKESEIIKEIFNLFINKNYGTARIAKYLNDHNIRTKKNKQNHWYQPVICKLLKNEIYIGNVINKKSEIVDFLTGKRKDLPREKWIIIHKPEFRIIDDTTFYQTQKKLESRKDCYHLMNKRESIKYPFSNLIQCSECGHPFRRLQRRYSINGKVFKKWADSTRNAQGKDACINKFVVDEDELLEQIKTFIQYLDNNRNKVVKIISNEIIKLVNQQNKELMQDKNDVQKTLDKLITQKEKYMDMYKEEIINIEELKKYTNNLNNQISQLKVAIQVSINKKVINSNIEKAVIKRFDAFSSIISLENLDNQYLKSIINKIIVYPSGLIKIAIKIDSDNNLNYELPLDIYEISLDEIIPTNNDCAQRHYQMEWLLVV